MSKENTTCKLSVILWDCGFREKTHAVDAYLNQSLDPDNYEIIWVEFYDRVLEAIKKYQDQYKNVRYVCLHQSGTAQYGMCINEGVRLAQGELLVISDGDVIVPDDFLENELALHAQSGTMPFINYHRRYDEPQTLTTVDPTDLESVKKRCTIARYLNYAGCFSMRKEHFIQLNGYEHGLNFHDACAREFNARAVNAGYLIRWDQRVDLFHPWHLNTGNTILPGQGELEHAIIDKRKLDPQATLPNCGFDQSLNKHPPDTVPNIPATPGRLRAIHVIYADIKHIASLLLKIARTIAAELRCWVHWTR